MPAKVLKITEYEAVLVKERHVIIGQLVLPIGCRRKPPRNPVLFASNILEHSIRYVRIVGVNALIHIVPLLILQCPLKEIQRFVIHHNNFLAVVYNLLCVATVAIW